MSQGEREIYDPFDPYADEPPEAIALDEAKRIARLAHLITLRSAQKAPRGILDPKNLVPWHEIPEYRRDAMAAGVCRVIQAMIILGYIER